ncbi:MAG: hypothetical protein IJD10_04930, partial [Clostridia bacterium]|nr:hypothetical protein [Clostridia bacterium]
MKRFSLFLLPLLLIGSILTSCGAKKDTDPRPLPDLPADAAALDALISSIDGATIENEDKIDRAYLGYWSLSEEERASVTGYETL